MLLTIYIVFSIAFPSDEIIRVSIRNILHILFKTEFMKANAFKMTIWEAI